MDDNVNREAIKHPEKMGPLGDKPEHPKDPHIRQPAANGPVQEQAESEDREQLTTSE